MAISKTGGITTVNEQNTRIWGGEVWCPNLARITERGTGTQIKIYAVNDSL